MKKEITDSQWATSFLANAYTEKGLRGFSEDMSDITLELVSKLKKVRKEERERIIEEIEKMKKKYETIDDMRGVHDEQAVGYNQAIDDIIKNLNQ